jgi:serine phosphatase RsbU (regulator of sigma subunit)
VLLTDGITEAAKPDGEEVGRQGLIRAVKGLVGESAPDLNARLLTDVKKFCDSGLEDDATLLGVGVLAA